MKAVEPVCGNCKHFLVMHGVSLDGECRRFPPSVDLNAERITRPRHSVVYCSRFPVVDKFGGAVNSRRPKNANERRRTRILRGTGGDSSI